MFTGKTRKKTSDRQTQEEIAKELGLSTGPPRDKDKRKLYKIRNAGQGQVKIRNQDD